MDKVARLIKYRLSKGEFRPSLHAIDRCGERFITEEDLKVCGKTAKKVEYQRGKDTWKVVGKDLDDNKLTVICDLEEMVIVTVF